MANDKARELKELSARNSAVSERLGSDPEMQRLAEEIARKTQAAADELTRDQ